MPVGQTGYFEVRKINYFKKNVLRVASTTEKQNTFTTAKNNMSIILAQAITITIAISAFVMTFHKVEYIPFATVITNTALIHLNESAKSKVKNKDNKEDKEDK